MIYRRDIVALGPKPCSASAERVLLRYSHQPPPCENKQLNSLQYDYIRQTLGADCFSEKVLQQTGPQAGVEVEKYPLSRALRHERYSWPSRAGGIAAGTGRWLVFSRGRMA